jgi:hypothetical protein
MNALVVPRCIQDGLLNFALIGHPRSGLRLALGTLRQTPGVTCHVDLFHPDEAVRRQAHEDYFGPSLDPDRSPEWFSTNESHPTNPVKYLDRVVWDNPRRQEQALGVLLTSDWLARYEIYDLLQARAAQGDFLVVYVQRNPIAAYISLKQAQQSQVWERAADDLSRPPLPLPVSLEIDELVETVRSWLGVEGKIRALGESCSDAGVCRLAVPFSSDGPPAGPVLGATCSSRLVPLAVQTPAQSELVAAGRRLGEFAAAVASRLTGVCA